MTQVSYQPAVAVAGATGAQGGATARALLAAGQPVRGLTRRQDSPAADELRRLGARVVYADFADPSSPGPAVTTPFETDPEREVCDGIALLDAAAASGTVLHIVYTSATNADRATGIPHFDSKHRVERTSPRSTCPEP